MCQAEFWIFRVLDKVYSVVFFAGLRYSAMPMTDLKLQCRLLVADALTQLARSVSPDVAVVTPDTLLLETPPSPEMGDVGIPLFPFAKTLRMAQPAIAAKAAALISSNAEAKSAGEFFAAGPYLNVRLNKIAATEIIFEKISRESAL